MKEAKENQKRKRSLKQRQKQKPKRRANVLQESPAVIFNVPGCFVGILLFQLKESPTAAFAVQIAAVVHKIQAAVVTEINVTRAPIVMIKTHALGTFAITRLVVLMSQLLVRRENLAILIRAAAKNQQSTIVTGNVFGLAILAILQVQTIPVAILIG